MWSFFETEFGCNTMITSDPANGLIIVVDLPDQVKGR